MNQDLKKAFHSIQYHPRETLSSSIAGAVLARAERTSQIRKWTFGILSLLCIIAIVPAIIGLLHQFSQTGFYQYSSLLFSSGGAMAGAWKSFALVLGESLPGTSIAIVLALLGLLVWSLRNTFTQTLMRRSKISIAQ